MAQKPAKSKPVRAKTRNPRPKRAPQMIRFEDFAENLAVLNLMIDDCWEVDFPAASDVAIFIENNGSIQERAEALLAVLPTAKRVFERACEKRESARKRARRDSKKD